MAVETTSYLVAAQQVATALGCFESGTLTAVTTTLATVGSYPFKTSRTNPTLYFEGAELYFTDGQFTPNPVEVKTYTASAGSFAPSIDWTDGGADPTTVNLFLRSMRIGRIKEAINRALRSLYYRQRAPLTLVADGDMQTSGVTNWTLSNSTLTKVSTAGNVYLGSQSLRVLNSGANGYGRSASMSVNGGDTYIFYAACRTAVSTGTLQIYDVTNSAVIDSETSDTGLDWQLLSVTAAIPATCTQIQVRLVGASATADVYWGYVAMLRQDSRRVALPDYILEKGQVLRVMRASPLEDNEADRDRYVDIAGWTVEPNQLSGLAAWEVVLPNSINVPIWLDVLRPYATLSADADTTLCPRELLIEESICELLRPMLYTPDISSKTWEAAYRDHLRIARQLRQRYQASLGVAV